MSNKTASRTIIVVPCYNEEKRIQPQEFLRLAQNPRIWVLFVNDGSADLTQEILEKIRTQNPEKIDVLPLAENSGKAEAVRQGMLQGIERGFDLIGFLDADLSTPVDEAERLVSEIDHSGVAVVLGARVALLGYNIQRHIWRHYLGRVFATVASNVLNLVVYDTQCGAKIFRSSALLRHSLQEKFFSSWIFDVELIGRLMIGRQPDLPGLRPRDFLEVPLKTWIDIKGSKMNLRQMLGAGVDLIRLGFRIREVRKAR